MPPIDELKLTLSRSPLECTPLIIRGFTLVIEADEKFLEEVRVRNLESEIERLFLNPMVEGDEAAATRLLTNIAESKARIPGLQGHVRDLREIYTSRKESFLLAFAMGNHARLGATSGLACFEGDLMAHITSFLD